MGISMICRRPSGWLSTVNAASAWPVIAVSARMGAVKSDVLMAKTLRTAWPSRPMRCWLNMRSTTRTWGLMARTMSVVEMLSRSSPVRMSTPRASATPAASRISRRRQSPLTRRAPLRRGSSARHTLSMTTTGRPAALRYSRTLAPMRPSPHRTIGRSPDVRPDMHHPRAKSCGLKKDTEPAAADRRIPGSIADALGVVILLLPVGTPHGVR